MAITYELEPHLYRELADATYASTARINARRDRLGLLPLDADDLVERAIDYAVRSQRASLVWYHPIMVNNREREAGVFHPVEVRSIDCIDGRIGRAKKGAIKGLKTEHAQIPLYRSPSTGLWIPQDLAVQETLEDSVQIPLEVSRIHNYDCKAWKITVSELMKTDSQVGHFLTDLEKRHILMTAQRDEVLSNLIYSELTNRRSFDNYYQEVHKLPFRVQVGVTLKYNLRTTGLELVMPLAIFNEKGETVGFPEERDIKRLSTSRFIDQLKAIQERLQDPHIPEAGSYKDYYVTPERFMEFSTIHTDLTVAFCKGRVEKDGQIWILPAEFAVLKEKMVDSYIRRQFPDLPAQSQKALANKFVVAGLRHYLLEGQTHTHHHREIHGSASGDGDFVGRNAFDYQNIRAHCPTPEIGENRILTASSVLMGNRMNEGKANLFFFSGSTVNESRNLFNQMVVRPGIVDALDRGDFIPLAAVLRNGMIIKVCQEAVRML